MLLTKNSFRVVFRQLYPQLALYASSLVKQHEVDDVIQDAFLELWRHIDRINDEKHLKLFLYKTVHSRALNINKHRTIENSFANTEQKLMASKLEYFNPDRFEADMELHNQELKQQIDEAIEQLPEKMRQVFMMSYIHDMKAKDIARIMGTSQRTVEGQIYKSVKLLREKLGKISLLTLILFCLQ